LQWEKSGKEDKIRRNFLC